MPGAPVISARTLLFICLASIGWSFSFGLGAPLASLWLRDHHFSNSVIGLSTGTYYFGIMLTSLLVPRMMRRWGRACPVAGMLISAGSVALFPWVDPFWGFPIRFLHGVSGAMSLVPIETFLNRHSPDDRRARNIGVYAFSVAFGWAGGNLAGLEMYSYLTRTAFALGGLASLMGGGLLWLGPRWPGAAAEHVLNGVRTHWGRHVLSYASAWCQGFLEGPMVALLPVYLCFLGLSQNRVSWSMSGIVIGVIVFQVPVAWLADRFGRAAVLYACYAVAGGCLAVLPWCGDSPWLLSCLVGAGAFSGAFYPLGLALLGERIPGNQLARAGAWYMTINCFGSVSGPVITGAVMDHFGKPAMFHAAEAAIVLAAVVGVCSGALRRKPGSTHETTKESQASLERSRAA